MTTIQARQIQLTKMRIRKTKKVLYIFCTTSHFEYVTVVTNTSYNELKPNAEHV